MAPLPGSILAKPPSAPASLHIEMPGEVRIRAQARMSNKFKAMAKNRARAAAKSKMTSVWPGPEPPRFGSRMSSAEKQQYRREFKAIGSMFSTLYR